MQKSSSITERALIALSIALVGLGIGCFSEHSTSTGVTKLGSCTAPGSAAGATIVFVHGFAFDPATVHVKAGGNVAWVNCETDGTSHTATSDGAGFNSGTFAPGASFIHAFSTADSIPYHCDIHPFMKGNVIVDP